MKRRRGRRPVAVPPAVTDAPRGLVVSKIETADGVIAIFSFELPSRGAAHALTAAEREVVTALLAHQSNAEIAQQRGTSLRTVANQVASIFRKLGVRSRSELVATGALFRGNGDR